MVDTIPSWLTIARGYKGEEEIPGPRSNATILHFIVNISTAFPEQAGYASVYKNDDTAWCGVFAADCLAEAGIRPVFTKGDDLRSWMWADAWMTWGVALSSPRVGAIVCFGGHVAFINRIIDADTIEVIGGNQSSPQGGAVTLSPRSLSSVKAMRWPSDAAAVVAPAHPITDALRMRDIVATVFGGAGDEQGAAYTDVDSGWPERPGVALPFYFSGDRPKVRVTNNATGKTVVCEIVDQGPWNYTQKSKGLTGDPYWLTGARPQAETGTDMTGRHTNGAGIDLTPAAARAIGIGGKGLVDWEFAGVDGEALDPLKPGEVDTTKPAVDASNQTLLLVLLILISKLKETSMSNEPASGQPDMQAVLAMLTQLLQPKAPPPPPPPPPQPAQPDLTALLAALVQSLGGKPLALPAPAPVAPVEAPVVQPVPVPASTSNGTLDMRAGIVGVLGSIGAWATGMISDPTAIIAAVASAGMAAAGIPAPIISVVGGLLSRIKIVKPATK